MDKEQFLPEKEPKKQERKEKKEPNESSFFNGFLCGMAAVIITALLYTVIQKPLIIPFSVFNQGEMTREQVTELLGKTMTMMGNIHERSILNVATDDELLSGMYKGLMSTVKDRYSVYYTPEEYESIRHSSNGQYLGLGVTVADDYLVIEVAQKGPADLAGVLPGDKIITINGKATETLSSAEFRNEIGNKAGKIIPIQVVREGIEEPLTLEVEIQNVVTQSVSWKKMEEGIYYIRIEHFSNNTSDQFNDAWKQIQEEESFRGLILDLRNNLGGGLDPTIAIAQSLVPKGLITYMEEKTGERIEYFSKGEGCPVPMTVLINGGSASASELLSAALQDTKTALLVGEQSFGKGIVQTTYTMNDGSAYKMTTAMYYTPNGTNFQDVGLTPDVPAALTEEEAADPARDYSADSQAKKALEVLKEQIEKKENTKKAVA